MSRRRKIVDLRQLEAHFAGYLEDIRRAAGLVARAKETFTAAYGERERRYQRTIGPLVDAVVAAWEKAGPALHRPIAARLERERVTLAARRRELRAGLLPELQEDVDGFVAESQADRARYQEDARRLKVQEEQLRAEIEAGEADLAALNAEIKKQGCFLKMLPNFSALRKSTRRRKVLLQTLQEKQEALGAVRREWKERREQFHAHQAELQALIREGLRERSELQAELDYLDDDEQRELLARQRAARHVLDARREPVVSPLPELQEEVNALVVLHTERDHYRVALMKAAHLSGLFTGIAEGVQAFRASAQKLYRQQQQYRQHLRVLKITLPNEAVTFFAAFRQLPQALQTDDPVAFATRADAFITGAGDTQIRQVFESLGAALNHATSTQWK